MRIAVGSDHAGFHLKEHIKAALVADGHELIDLQGNMTALVHGHAAGHEQEVAGPSGKRQGRRLDARRCCEMLDLGHGSPP